MPVFRLNRDDVLFPPVELAAASGLLAVGGNMTPVRLLAAYSQGIFPWGKVGRQYVWFSPDPRLVLFPQELHVSHSMRRIVRHSPFTVTVDTAFRRVMESCAASPRGEDGTWINPEMIHAYTALHEAGHGHSVEVWSEDGNMAGGLYGISLGRCFFGESMFTLVPNASKLALVCLANLLRGWKFDIIDCQQVTDHMMRMGARPISRAEYMRRIAESQRRESPRGKWTGPSGDSLLLERQLAPRRSGKQGESRGGTAKSSHKGDNMSKIKIDNNAFTYPMPMTLVGAMVGDKPNFLAVAWVTRVNYKPPMIAVALGKTHHTNPGIHATKAFSVNIPGVDLMDKADYCGIVSGKKADKSGLFRVFKGEVTGAPMIDECRLCMECKVVQVVDLPADELFIGEIVGAYADEGCMTDGKPDVKKIDPFTLTMPDNGYWRMGAKVGEAWSARKKINM